MYDELTGLNLNTGCDGAAALVAAACGGRKVGRLVVVMGAVDEDILAALVTGWRAQPMVTLLTGPLPCVHAVAAAHPGFFYNEHEALDYDSVRAFLPWLEVWMVGADGGMRLVASGR